MAAAFEPEFIVLCPMRIEHDAVAAAVRRAGLSHVRVIQTGIGAAAILAHVERLAGATVRPRLVLLAGACGALAETSDVPEIARIIDQHAHTWVGAVGMSPVGVTLIGVDDVIATPDEKRALAARTGAAIVDMESHAFAAHCERLGLRWGVVRGVSDHVHESLPKEVLRWITPAGDTHAGRAVLDMALRPSLIPHIVGVLRRSRRVLPQVGDKAVAIIREFAKGEIRSPSAGAMPGVTPLPLPVELRGVSEILIVGGTFDPVHLAHVELPSRVRESVEQGGGQAWLLYVPAARSPHKTDGPLASDQDRLAMLGLALEGHARCGIWTDELDRARSGAGPSFTVDTLRRARGALDARGGAAIRLRLIIGTDQAAVFHRWREPREIIMLAEPLVMPRPAGVNDAPVNQAGSGGADWLEPLWTAGFWTEPELQAWSKRLATITPINASSTQVRQALAATPRDRATLATLLDPKVLSYIEQHALYR